MRTIIFVSGLFVGVCGALWATGQAELPVPLTLEVALSHALEHNPTLKLVKEELREQKGVLVQSVSGLLPRVTATAEGTQVEDSEQWSAGVASNGGTKTWSASLTLRQTVFAGGSVVQGVRSSRARMQAAKERLREQVEMTIYETKEAFCAVLVGRETIKVREEAVAVLEDQLKDVQARCQAGVASEFELLQAQVAVANERPSLIRARTDYQVKVQNLLAVLGVQARAEVWGERVEGRLKPEMLQVELDALLQSAKRNRAQLHAVAKDMAAAKAEVWQKRGAYFPKVEAVAAYDWTKNATTTSLGEYVEGWRVGLVASVDLFNGWGREAEIYQARARARQAQARQTRAQLEVEVEVRQAYASFTQAVEILVFADKAVEQAKESLRLAKARYAAGSSTQLEVLQAQAALSQARLSELQAQYDCQVAAARLQKATGSREWSVKEAGEDEE